MNPFFEMVVVIVIVVTIGRVISHRRSAGRFDHDGRDDRIVDAGPPVETARLKDEVQQLKQRIQVLERIAVDKENSIAREIEQLRDR